MTVSNMIELVILLMSLASAFIIVRGSNQKVADLDGLGRVIKKQDCKGKVIAHM